MNVIVLAAGLGTRLRPHTLHRPKPLLHVGDDVVLAHVRRALGAVDITRLVFVVGHLGDQIRTHVVEQWDPWARFVVQEDLRGQAHAVALAGEHLDGPTLVVLPDMVFAADLGALPAACADGVVFARAVPDPRRFGVVVTDAGGHAARFVEKPRVPVSDQAVVGLYYLADGARLLAAVERLMRTPPRGGEYYLADALQIVVDDGGRLEVRPVGVWEDCGTVGDLLRANRFLLERMPHAVPASIAAANVILPPVHIAAGARVSGSRVGPFAFIGPDSQVSRSTVGPHVALAGAVHLDGSTIADSIVEHGTVITAATLTGSLVGRHARVEGVRGQVNIGDWSTVGTARAGPEGDNVVS
jgi:glucose-1-phosphate thymidylyltransferase